MSPSYSRMREFSSLPSASTIPLETLSYVSDIMAISMFNMMRGMKMEAIMKRTHIEVV